MSQAFPQDIRSKLSSTAEQALAEMRRRFCAGLDERIFRIETARVSLAEGGLAAQGALKAVSFEAHRIAGVAGSLGLAHVGTEARALETLIGDAPPIPRPGDDIAGVDARIDAFLDLLERHLIED